ncbi:type I restriction endonuclease subunit R [Helicobacter muridarum]|uniref:type I site-specific deoxyribonuclease n=1 Tax=Helicobacter muridarum TaxID=216 RepID=A0A377PVX9_9HELI|nr:type I restriction endonuclease subunit R [Helicobacter muridarum]STQ85783.1 type I site-specific deoxyribonuclease [Helicobacter muridarum]
MINQYDSQGDYKNRYDVSILVNGLPLAHIELKRRGKDLKEAFNQIERYGRESFFAGNGLYDWVQMFVISNGTYTKYYSNTTRKKHCEENDKSKGKKTNHNFEFTCFWSDMQNEQILDLIDFAKTFFTRHSLLNILIKYSVFDIEENLKIMRPYQIAATEAIERKVKTSLVYKKYGSLEGCGYIWHSTGSGKTLTSFKSAQLLTQIQNIEKVLFVVDRKDLDTQTIGEYEKFQKGCVKANSSTKELK